jgi:glycosyltransferase involved in cell wall biosynthesis
MNFIKKPILSIVIPTINRYETLIPLIENLMMWDYDNFEIIINDNSQQNDEFLIFLNGLVYNDKLKYFHIHERLSAIENCDLAISRATGTYVCFIGDDDGLVPQTIDFCIWMKENNIQSMYCNIGLYTWPETGHAVNINKGFNSKLVFSKYSGKLSIVDPRDEMEKLIKSGAQNLFNVPRVYQGIVSKKCLQSLFDNLGTYFPGPVPDMSNAIALNSLVEKHCFIDLPIIISGHSKKSMSGRNSLRLHQGEIRQEESLPNNTLENWSPKIPLFWSAPTIWAEAALKASTKMGMDELFKKFNYARVYANCFAFCDKKFYSRTIKVIFENNGIFEILNIIIKINYYLIEITLKRVLNFSKKYIIGIKGIYCNDIGEAILQTKKVIGNYEKYIKK